MDFTLVDNLENDSITELAERLLCGIIEDKIILSHEELSNTAKELINHIMVDILSEGTMDELELSSVMYNIFKDRVKIGCVESLNLLTSKNRDYSGNNASAIRNFEYGQNILGIKPTAAILSRIMDKISRVDNLFINFVKEYDECYPIYNREEFDRTKCLIGSFLYNIVIKCYNTTRMDDIECLRDICAYSMIMYGLARVLTTVLGKVEIGGQILDEKIDDTILDIFNYSCIAYAYNAALMKDANILVIPFPREKDDIVIVKNNEGSYVVERGIIHTKIDNDNIKIIIDKMLDGKETDEDFDKFAEFVDSHFEGIEIKDLRQNIEPNKYEVLSETLRKYEKNDPKFHNFMEELRKKGDMNINSDEFLDELNLLKKKYNFDLRRNSGGILSILDFNKDNQVEESDNEE